MNQAELLQLAQLLAQLLPLGISAYTQIAAANQDAGLKLIADILAAADANFDIIGKTADAELEKIVLDGTTKL